VYVCDVAFLPFSFFLFFPSLLFFFAPFSQGRLHLFLSIYAGGN
jgi:hypothetical protein